MRRFRVYIFFIILAISPFALAAIRSVSPPLISHGLGPAASTLGLTRNYLSQLLALCESSVCRLNENQRQSLVVLLSRAAEPPEIVMTDSSVLNDRVFEVKNGKVWFNRELLWKDAEHTEPLDEASALCLWIDVLTQKEVDPEAFLKDLIAIKRELALISPLYQEKGKDWISPYGEFETMIWRLPHDKVRLFIRDPAFQNFELTAWLEDRAQCENQHTEASDIVFESPDWLPGAVGPDLSSWLSLNVLEKWTCRQTERQRQLRFHMRIVPDVIGLKIDPKSFRAVL